jgi:hypothetical protein
LKSGRPEKPAEMLPCRCPDSQAASISVAKIEPPSKSDLADNDDQSFHTTAPERIKTASRPSPAQQKIVRMVLHRSGETK